MLQAKLFPSQPAQPVFLQQGPLQSGQGRQLALEPIPLLVRCRVGFVARAGRCGHMIQQAADAAVFAELERIETAHLQRPLDRIGSLELTG